MDVLKICPYLVPQNVDCTEYDGYIKVGNHSYRIRLELPEVNTMEGAKIWCEWKLKQLLRDYEDVLTKRLQQSPDLCSFLLDLRNVIENKLQNEPLLLQHPPAKFYASLLEEIEQLGWQRVQYVSTTFQDLNLLAKDAAERSHLLKVHLGQKHPEQPPTCTTDLPVAFDFAWSRTGGLDDLFRQFQKCLRDFTDFWDTLDEVDSKTWVLEPERPTRACRSRRIAIGNNASIQIEMDWRHPRMLPECCFLGADRIINPLKKNLNSNLHLWNPGRGLIANLEEVLAISFPSPSNTSKEEFSVDCGICYSYRLEEQIPDQVCDDPRCGQTFHHACLYEWLRALPSCRQSFNVIFGECPYCSKPITVKMPLVR